ncbi:MAG: aminotransferase class III-fold pyridoxal phosphate-dependent enzyme [Candidatus Latescibacteria bacterium]|nr:aminotransferase class III-fold pyridoxal phosphate-dependent enzyme [Candidatus Latescibacterota bacterium]
MDREKLLQATDRLIGRYVKANPQSQALSARARQSLPGGNTRTGAFCAPFPPYIERGEGVYIFAADGHQLLDFSNNNTALILGHAHPAVVEALQRQIALGTAFSRPMALEIEMAELLRQRLPSLERLRFCSSGTEAVIQAVRSAKAFTGRVKIAKVEGAYHGVGEHALVSYVPSKDADLGPADRPLGVPSSAGLSPGAVDEVVVLPFNDAPACAQIIAEQGDDLAAVLVDPLNTGAGFTPPVDDFLSQLAAATRRAGALLIFDEIISFRVGRGGAQELYGVRPDLTCLGKVVAGGTPGAAFGGRADIMALYDPTQKAPAIPQSGTYNGNPISMVAGLVTLGLLTEEVYARLDELCQRLGDGLESVFRDHGVEAAVTTLGSLFQVHYRATTPRDYRQILAEAGLWRNWLFYALLEQGIHWAGHGNVSVPMTQEHVDALVAGVRRSLADL